MVRQVCELSGVQPGAKADTCPRLTEQQSNAIAALLEPWKSRPIHFAFLVRVLSEESIWQAISTAKGKSGKTLEETNAAVAAQAAETGALADIGELDTESLQGLFGIDPTDPSRFEHGAPGIDDDIHDAVADRRTGARVDTA